MELDFVSYAMGKAAGGGGSAPVIQALSATENGTYTAPSGVDGYSPVTVNVPGSTLEWNEPIIRNWDFTNPINTRGSSEYTGNASTINGWKQTATTKTQLVSGGIYVIATSSSSGTNMYYQGIIDSSSPISNKTMTLSMMANNKVAHSTCVIDISESRQTEVLIDGVYFWFNIDSGTRFGVGLLNNGPGDNTLVQAVKLEFGSVSTLCDQNGANASIRKHQKLDEEVFFLSILGVNN